MGKIFQWQAINQIIKLLFFLILLGNAFRKVPMKDSILFATLFSIKSRTYSDTNSILLLFN